MTQWLRALWEKITLFVTSDSFVVVIGSTNGLVRMSAAAFAVALGLVFTFFPTLNQSWAEPLSDQLFRIATQLWSGATWNP